MNTSHVKYLLLGAGLASASAAAAIRKLDERGELMLLGQERLGPYVRPPLSKKYLSRGTDRAGLFTHEPGWYAEHRVQLRTGVRAEQLDTARQMVSLESNEEISYEKLLIAIGRAPLHLTIPGANLPNLYYLRTADDADRLFNAIEKALHEGQRHERGRGRAAVIGGGLLGIELASSFTQRGLAVDLFVSKSHPWHKFAGEHTGRFLTRFLENHGITVHCGAPPRALEGDGRVQRIVTDDGRSIPADFVAAAVGVAVNRELLRGTPIRCEKAILTDEHCRTNVETVYAAGDCAAVFDPLFGKHRTLDHYDSAITTGTIAGTNMAGGDVAYNDVNCFYSDVFDLKMQGWGESKQVDRRLIRAATGHDAQDLVEIGIAPDGRIAQIVAINHVGEDDLLKQLVARRVRIDGNEEALKDPAVPLESLLQ